MAKRFSEEFQDIVRVIEDPRIQLLLTAAQIVRYRSPPLPSPMQMQMLNVPRRADAQCMLSTPSVNEP